jgi:O-antigen ligase
VPSLVAGRVPIAVLLGVAGLILAVAWRDALTPAMLRAGLATPLGIVLVAMFALWLVPVFVTIDLKHSWQVWAMTASFIAGGALLLAALRAAPALLDVAERALVAGAVVMGAIAVVSLFLWPPILDPLHTSRIASTDNAVGVLRVTGSVAPCLAAVVLWAGWRQGGLWHLAGIVFLPIAALIVIGTLSHAGFLGAIVAVLALCIAWLYARLTRHGRIWLIATLAAAAIAGAILILSLLPVPPYAAPEPLHIPLWLVDAHRQYIWGFAYHTGLTSPWIGFGLDTAGRVPGAKAFLPGFGATQTMPSHAHNWMLELFVEGGVLVLGTALIALGVFARGLLQGARRGEPGAYAAIALSGAYFGSGLVNFSVWSAWWQVSFLVLLAIALAAPAAPQSAPGR